MAFWIIFSFVIGCLTGGFFGLLIGGLNTAASREMPKPGKFDCTCGDEEIPGLHRKDGYPCIHNERY